MKPKLVLIRTILKPPAALAVFNLVQITLHMLQRCGHLFVRHLIQPWNISSKQLEEAKRPEDHKKEDQANQPDVKSEDNAIEMSEDFDAKVQDLEDADKQPDDDDDDKDDGDDEIDKQMGDVDDQDTEKLDEQMWGSDDENEEGSEVWEWINRDIHWIRWKIAHYFCYLIQEEIF